MADLIRIVVIDDNARSLELLSAALGRDGISVHTANDPEEPAQDHEHGPCTTLGIGASRPARVATPTGVS